MATASLNNDTWTVDTGKDSLVIKKYIYGIVGGATLNVADYPYPQITAGHVIIKETSTGDYKPMPGTEAKPATIATLGSVTGGTTYTNGVYENVPAKGGSGSGAMLTVTVSGAVVSAVAKTNGGTGYKVADVLTFDNTYVGGTGSGASVPVATISDAAAAYNSLPAGHTYAGILVSSILTAKPFAGIINNGVINPNVLPYPITSIQAAIETATKLQFIAD